MSFNRFCRHSVPITRANCRTAGCVPARRGYNLTHLSRPVRTEEILQLQLIIGMDDPDIDDTLKIVPLQPAEWSKIHRMSLTEYCTKFTHVDPCTGPYYGGSEGLQYAGHSGRCLCGVTAEHLIQRHHIQCPLP